MLTPHPNTKLLVPMSKNMYSNYPILVQKWIKARVSFALMLLSFILIACCHHCSMCCFIVKFINKLIAKEIIISWNYHKQATPKNRSFLVDSNGKDDLQELVGPQFFFFFQIYCMLDIRC